jgi:hypothetical protein
VTDLIVPVLSGVLGGGLIGGIVGAWVENRLARRAARETELLAEKRKVYQALSESLRLFVGEADRTPSEEQAFLRAYHGLWLWASDSVIRKANVLVELLRRHQARGNVDQAELRTAYGNLVVTMRSELGFEETLVTADEFEFITITRPRRGRAHS